MKLWGALTLRREALSSDWQRKHHRDESATRMFGALKQMCPWFLQRPWKNETENKILNSMNWVKSFKHKLMFVNLELKQSRMQPQMNRSKSTPGTTSSFLSWSAVPSVATGGNSKCESNVQLSNRNKPIYSLVQKRKRFWSPYLDFTSMITINLSIIGETQELQKWRPLGGSTGRNWSLSLHLRLLCVMLTSGLEATIWTATEMEGVPITPTRNRSTLTVTNVDPADCHVFVFFLVSDGYVAVFGGND